MSARANAGAAGVTVRSGGQDLERLFAKQTWSQTEPYIRQASGLPRPTGGAVAIWIITPRGFYSAVAKPGDDDEFVTVRARSEHDIRNLADLIDAEPSRDDGTDYRWRIRCSKDDWARACAAMAHEVDYSNFKSRIAADDPERAQLLGQVWNVLYEIQQREGTP